MDILSRDAAELLRDGKVREAVHKVLDRSPGPDNAKVVVNSEKGKTVSVKEAGA